MGKTRPPYSAEFRREALSTCGGAPGHRLSWPRAELHRADAAQTGCRSEARWGERTDVLSGDEPVRLHELDREVKVVRGGRDPSPPRVGAPASRYLEGAARSPLEADSTLVGWLTRALDAAGLAWAL